MELGKTERGFAIGRFIDANGVECSIQKSSVATDDMIWLGCSKPNAKQFPGDNTGWHDYPLPDNVQCTTRMHLTVEQVIELLPILTQFAYSGELQ